MNPTRAIAHLLLSSTVVFGVLHNSAQAQVTPASNDANTVVTPSGNTFDITGGTTAGANLFHSFQTFGLNADQIANFRANPAVQNILSRVVGGDASVINGLIRVTGSNANLYLMNPAGIVFADYARLDVAGSFTATTANGIGFGTRWFNAIGSNDYANLIGTPNSFAFTMSQPGSIINAGSLSVKAGQSITLLGGTVINTGTLTAPGGKITIAAVPGEKLVNISQDGSLLNLALPVDTGTAVNALPFTPLTLPQLLTGGNLSNATGVVVENGAVKLTGSGVSVPTESGTAIVSNTVNVFGTSGGTVFVLGNKVGLVGANINASGTNGGGNVLIGGDYQGKGTVPNAQQTFVSPDSVIRVDAVQRGNGGRAIVWSNQRTEFYGTIWARGGTQAGNGGFVEVSGKNNLVYRGTVNTSSPVGKSGSLLLDPTNILIKNGTGDGDDNGVITTAFGNNITGDNGRTQAVDAAPTVIYESELEGMTAIADIILEATNNITIENLTDDELKIGITDNNPSSITFKADSDQNGVGSFVMDQGDTIFALERKVTIAGANVIAGNIDTMDRLSSDLNASLEIISSGDIQVGKIEVRNSTRLYTSGGNIRVATIETTSNSGERVNIDISTPGLFQATGSSQSFSEPLIVVDIDAEENKDLKQFLQARGVLNLDGSINNDKNIFRNAANQPRYTDTNIVTVDPVSGKRTIVEDITGLTASILGRNGDAGSQITIRHGGKPVSNNSGFVTIETTSGGNGTAQFIVGPQGQRLNQFEVVELSTERFNPGRADGIRYLGPAVRFQTYSPLTFGSDQFPSNVSGTAGTIATTAGQNSNGSRSFPGIPFVPMPVRIVDLKPVNPTGENERATLEARFKFGEDGQVAQRQLNRQTKESSCGLSDSVASAPSAASGQVGDRARTTSASATVTNTPCDTGSNDEQILKILEATP